MDTGSASWNEMRWNVFLWSDRVSYHEYVWANLQSPPAEFLQTFSIGADVLQKLLYWMCVLLTTHIDVHAQVL